MGGSLMGFQLFGEYCFWCLVCGCSWHDLCDDDSVMTGCR